MKLNQPYYRIARPDAFIEYCEDERYANDRSMLCRSYKMLENDLKKVFEFIEPCDDNLNAYSHRLYELLLRACTEFETNSKRILESNGYVFNGNPNITDYFKINKATKLSEYEVYLDYWRPNRKLVKPFDNWNNGQHSLRWYQSYNLVKHDRQANFACASFENVINSVAAVLVILYAQFDFLTITPYQANKIYLTTTDGDMVTIAETIFEVVKPKSWSEEEKYQFDWSQLKTNENPFRKYNF